jgi:hypothetical protein
VEALIGTLVVGRGSCLDGSMTRSERAAVDRWVPAARAELSVARFAQIDLDDLVGPPPPLAVRAALRCMELACEGIRDAVPEVVGLVLVPLPAAGRLTPEAPTIDELLGRPWQFGPGRSVPGVYLLADPSWSLGWDAEVSEEYRRAMPTGALEGATYRAYYRTWKVLGGEDGSPPEYDRAVYITSSLVPPSP